MLRYTLSAGAPEDTGTPQHSQVWRQPQHHLIAHSISRLLLQVDVRCDDFERETANRMEMASRYQSLVELVAAKDRIILQMLKDRDALTAERDAAVGGKR